MLSILFGLIISFVHYISGRMRVAYSQHRQKTISLTAGVFIAYIFLHMFPNLYEPGMSRISMLFVLVGFSLFHILEKHAYKHGPKKMVLRELRREHSIAFFIYHFFIGILLYSLLQKDVVTGVLFFVPILSFTAISSISMREIHEMVRESRVVRAALSVSTLFGAALARYLPMSTLLYQSIFGFVVGTLLYIVIIDSIPREREGSPAFFALGVVLYSIIIYTTWLI